MSRRIPIVAAVTVTLVAGLGSAGAGDPTRLVDLDTLEPLQRGFQEDEGNVRVIALLSPT